MKVVQLILILFIVAVAAPVLAQRDANTSSARAAYSVPQSYDAKKKKSKKAKTKRVKKARKQNGDAVRQRGRPLGF